MRSVTVFMYLYATGGMLIRASVYRHCIGMAWVKSHVIRIRNDSKLGENDSPWLQNL